MPFVHVIMFIKDSLQQQIHFNGNIVGNKCCCNEGYSILYGVICSPAKQYNLYVPLVSIFIHLYFR